MENSGKSIWSVIRKVGQIAAMVGLIALIVLIAIMFILFVIELQKYIAVASASMGLVSLRSNLLLWGILLLMVGSVTYFVASFFCNRINK
jgi:hypothetical protein